MNPFKIIFYVAVSAAAIIYAAAIAVSVQTWRSI